MQRDIQIRIVDRWALASDGVQWVVQKQAGDSWVALKFIRSTKHTLEWSMGRAGVPCHIRERLIEGLPDTFDEWREDVWHGLVKQSRRLTGETAKAAMTPPQTTSTSLLGDKEAA